MLKIAIVDDDNACLEQEAAYTARYAKEKQLQIETSIFHSGMELMKQLSNRFDIIFLDIEMDGMDGMETAREIRKAGSDAVIVFITNLGIRYENVYITKELNNATLTSMSSKRLGPGLYIINSSIRIEAKLSCTLLHMLYVNGMADDIGSVALTLPPGQQYLNHTCIISISEENTNLELRARQDGNSVVTGTSWMIITRIK